MYSKRLKIFISIFIIFISICILRLFQLQVISCNDNRDKIAKIGLAAPKTLPTLRGRILDRNGNELAVDRPKFYLNIRYSLTRLMDERFWEANAIIRAMSRGADFENTSDYTQSEDYKEAREYWENKFSGDTDRLYEIIETCSQLPNIAKEDVIATIHEINSRMWKLRRYFARRRNFPDSTDYSEFNKLPAYKQLKMEGEVNDLAEMKTQWYELAELEQSEDRVDAQNYFADVKDVCIKASPKRCYPYGESASQVIGWVNPSKPDEDIFEKDELARYEHDELAGYMGVEYVCEPLLRGRRGVIVQKKRDEDPEVTPRVFGRDVMISLDIDLQQKIEEMLGDPSRNPNIKQPVGLCVIDVQNNQILASISTPSYNLKDARADFRKVKNDPQKPLENKVLYNIYPPGSSIKPFILAIGLEERIVSPTSTISCPYTPQKNWPRCWIQRQWGSHDAQWEGEGGNNGINAIRGSCNSYFTKLASRIDADALQKWLWDFGFGKEILQSPDFSEISDKLERDKLQSRNLRESPGSISDKRPEKNPVNFSDIPRMSKGERKWFGMGQGNLWVTVLQVANAMAALARDGVYKTPILYIDPIDKDSFITRDLHLSQTTIQTVRKGMHAVVNKLHGSAYNVFRNSGFDEKGITIYGKTGSTQAPENAWFTGFAEDKKGRSIAFALIVVGGKSGSRDGAPLGKEVFELCCEAGYIGNN